MDLNLSETQTLLLNSASKFLDREAKNLFRQAEKTAEGYSPEHWKKIGELGWLGLPFPEKYGGSGGSVLDLVLLLEEMGKALFPGPFVATVVCGLALLHYGTEKQKDELLPGVVEGSRILSPAFLRPQPGVQGIAAPEEKVSVRGGGHLLTGTRLFVPFGHAASGFLYRAETERGTKLFLVRSPAPGLRCTALQSMGGEKPCELTLEGVPVSGDDALGGDGEQIAQRVNEWGALAESAYLAGMLKRVLDLSVEHAKEREQFGKKIGSFQAIQHQCADMATDVDQVRFLTYQAAWKLSQGLAARKEISMAKAWASDASRRVCLLGVKIHGGMGVSEEYEMQLYFRRAKPAELAYGDGYLHREVVAEELGL